MTVSPAPLVRFRGYDNNNVPLVGGKLFTYAAGTTTKQATYTDSTGVTQNTNPIILDSRGEADVYLSKSLAYKFVLAPATDTDPPTNPFWTRDSLTTPTSLPSLLDFGGVGNDSTDNTAAINAAEASPGKEYAPYGIYKSTIAATALTGPFWGDGQILDSSNNKRGPWFSAISAAPSAFGNDSSADTAFNGDLSHNQIAMEHRITGAATLGQPTTGYNYTNEAYPFFGYLYNSSGWNNSTSDNTGRTAACFNRVKVYHVGQGDGVAYNASAYVAGARSGATSFLANPAGVLFNGDAFAGAAGVYLNCYETNAHDQGFDVACLGSVYNFDRNNNTGGLGAWWGGVRFQSSGTKAVDNMLSAIGAFNGGIDFSMSTLSFGTNKAAVILQAGHRIYGNASSTNASYATTFGNDWIERASGGFWSLVFNSVSALQVNDQKVNCLVPLQVPNYTVATLPAAGSSLKGARAFATDLSGATYTFGTAAVGGGSRGGPVFCDGSSWREG